MCCGMVTIHVAYDILPDKSNCDTSTELKVHEKDCIKKQKNRKICLDYKCFSNMYRIYYDSEDTEPLIQRRSDREEIRRKLAMDDSCEEEDLYPWTGCRLPLNSLQRRPSSLGARLQSGMNLQICFMNETTSDQEEQSDDSSSPTRRDAAQSSDSSLSPNNNNSNFHNSKSNEQQNLISKDTTTNTVNGNKKSQRPSFFSSKRRSWRLRLQRKNEKLNENETQEIKQDNNSDVDFHTKHARLQAEARLALAQAKEMARMQMEVEKQNRKKSPIMDIVGMPNTDHRHLSRQILSEMNVAQLQIIVNDLHTQIENLNEDLVRFLLARDDLHMEQDSMLVDIEDLTRYLGAKDEAQCKHQILDKSKNNNKK